MTAEYYVNHWVRHWPGERRPTQRHTQTHMSEREALDDAVEGMVQGWVYETTTRMVWHSNVWHPHAHPLDDAIRVLKEAQRDEETAERSRTPSWEPL